MNGYRARVQRHREQLAEEAERCERTAIPGYIWRAAILGGRRIPSGQTGPVTTAPGATEPVKPAPPAQPPADTAADGPAGRHRA